jgi:hypothetical protein
VEHDSLEGRYEKLVRHDGRLIADAVHLAA